MARRCCILGRRPARGRRIRRKGKPKKEGGIGTHVTANTPRVFFPNFRRKKLFVPELGRWVSLRLSARGLKTLSKKGSYATLREAGVLR
ncbi:50S ribosomal protein L28 [Methylacidimicrobium sp. AP8]|uniref:50S ribosomal protein L28 n=1 Tax=Methylacidimicrobium sp. AP8 TaxID=2730359 RepID=UPI0018C0DBF7|nr:50S ribosomal protein L28 [Methylacidimicrobium sp. AP8]CAB4244072.1 50S ribosomal protein L28 [Methylacidimicrobium sp. AP8]